MSDSLLFRELESLPESTTPAAPHGVAGKCTVTTRLAPRPIILRVVERDGNGVRADAEAAVDRAAGSSGAALPAHLQRQFELSTGADLSSVRVHTGAASAQAAQAVGARAYTVGQDIHFGAGNYQPDDPFGMHLLAHEVAHTVQQQGGAATRQHKLEVSTPQDAAEVEADRAADAMVSGAPAAIAGASGGVARKVWRGPNNSYSKGEGLTWGGGTALTEEENKQWAEKQAGFAKKGAGFVAKKLGLEPGAVIKQAKARVDTDIEVRQNLVDHLKRELKARKGQDNREIEQQLAAEERGLAGLKGSRDDVVTKATEMANKAAEGAKSLAGLGDVVVKMSGGKIETTMFKSMAEVGEKLENVTKLVDAAHQVYETDSALKAFQAQPSFDTAAAWGNAVAKSLSMCSSLVSGLPMGWGDVISGALQMPQVVIPAFISISRAYQARIDAATKDGTGKGKILGDGETG